MIADNVKSWATKVSVFDMSGGYIGSGFFLEENKDIETCLVDIKGKQLVYNVKEYNIVKFGAKTYTDFDDVNGSSLIVNYSGICGVLETINEDR